MPMYRDLVYHVRWERRWRYIGWFSVIAILMNVALIAIHLAHGDAMWMVWFHLVCMPAPMWALHKSVIWVHRHRDAIKMWHEAHRAYLDGLFRRDVQ